MVDRYSFNSAGEDSVSPDDHYVAYEDYAEIERLLSAEQNKLIDSECHVADLERQRDALQVSYNTAQHGYDALAVKVNELLAENSVLKEIFDSVTNLDNEPEYHEQGMGCGLEDRNIHDRYEAMHHGWECAMERVYGEVIPSAEEISFPATDAALREIGAKAVEKCADVLSTAEDISPYGHDAMHAYAQQLREGKV